MTGTRRKGAGKGRRRRARGDAGRRPRRGPRGPQGAARWRRRAAVVLRWTLISSVWGAVALGALVAWFAYDLPRVEDREAPVRRASVTLTDRHGAPVLTYGDFYAESLSVENAPADLRNAILAIEDRRFFDHGGFDALAVARALAVNLFAGKVRQGASTITQQLAKNLFLTPERTVRRKVQELLLAFWLEANFTKEQIFALYMNRVYLGSGTYGVAGAARRYFGKAPGELTLLEAAAVAGLLKAPSRFSPLRDRDRAERRARVVLKAMLDAGFIDAARFREAAAGRLRVAAAEFPSAAARYFADWALERTGGFVGPGQGDLIVRTTLDMRLQHLAERRLRETVAANRGKRGVTQGALVAMTTDGAVRALVGGVDYRRSQFNRATDALRQPGSVFKLFVYLAALESGLRPGDGFVDGPLAIGKWRPRNYPDRHRGEVTLREAFARSINTVAVRVSERVGRRRVIEAARRLGVTTPLKAHPSLALGASEVSLLELTAAYAVIANRGLLVWPHGILEIRRRSGEILYRREADGPTRVVNGGAARDMDGLLRAAVASGTGRRAGPGVPAAGKTGTSQDFRDAWFVGYVEGLVAGVWVGNDDGRPMRRVTGGNLPAPLWRGFVRDALGPGG